MFRALADYRRLIRAGITLTRHDVILPGEYQTRLPWPARLFGRVLRLIGGGAKGRPGERLARALERLGPAYIKLGQFLATRPDVFGVETTTDLSRLKDALPPFSMDKARAALAAEFGEAEAARLFPDLSAPIAAASLAQVHRMETPQGPRAVKILRPGVERMVLAELSAMARAARTIERVAADSRRLEPVAFVTTLARSMETELDLRLEAGGTDEMRAICSKTGHFHVPDVDWTRSGKRVLTTTWVDGIRLTDTAALARANFDRKAAANAVTQGFLASAIQHGVFHADMHEGNMILAPDGRLTLIDFGILGRIDADARRYLAEILFGFIRRDYTRIAEVHFEAGYVPPDRSVGDFAQALRSVGEPIFGKTAREVSMGRLLLQLLDFTHTFGMHLRPELVLLQKTMVQVEGVARTLDPEHDIWAAARPIVEGWVRSSLGPAGQARSGVSALLAAGARLKSLPRVMDTIEARLTAPPPPAAPATPKTAAFGWLSRLALLVLTGASVAIAAKLWMG
jgi:ubiquinone biosynthesis protein